MRCRKITQAVAAVLIYSAPTNNARAISMRRMTVDRIRLPRAICALLARKPGEVPLSFQQNNHIVVVQPAASMFLKRAGDKPRRTRG
ncbi:hypothetical protein FORC74_4051 [Salmonella enterica]|nr:hypothetical protein FORC74_4051 [Salmonella enterica]